MNIQLPTLQGVVEIRPTLKGEEVAHALGMRSVASFYKRRPLLEKSSFPAKLPGLNAWSRAAVERWIDGNGEPQAVEPPPARRPTRLERRFAQ